MLNLKVLVYLNLFLSIFLISSHGYALDYEHRMHPVFNFHKHRLQKRAMPEIKFESIRPEEEFAGFWNNVAQNILEKQLETKAKPNTNIAKNVILFLGDGMSIPTITATRVYIGGEEKQLSFEKFPYVGLSKTYCANTQVADSACTATAYLGGVKANYATIGVSAAVELNDCQAQNDTLNHVKSIAHWAQQHGMATGLITTTGVTHASPAGVYAHTANRNWENDAEVLSNNGDPEVCSDIAMQLVHGPIGSKLNVILGGGRQHFLPSNKVDIDGRRGRRVDGKNLIEEWQLKHGRNAHYIETKNELFELPSSAERIMGLFASNELPFHLDADLSKIPTLEEMVAIALELLEKQSNGKGYFLFVEGGRIDHAHHDTMAMKALDETAQFNKAVKLAEGRTSPDDTLIVVTSDHSHTMSVAGYSSRRNDIFGINDGQLAADNLPYATLSYANGPGFENNIKEDVFGTAKRINLRHIDMKNKDFKYPTAVPLNSETHGGDDVGVFVKGPFSHLFTGVYEQNFIPHAIGYAACLRGTKNACTMQDRSRQSS